MPTDTDWRDAYNETIAEAITEYRRIRVEDPARRVSVPGRRTMLAARYLTDTQIDAIAWREAESDINYARNQQSACEARAKARASQAL